MRRVTTTMHVDRDGVAVRLDIAGDYYPGEPARTGPDDPCPGSSGEVNLISVALNGAAFWGELTDEERRQAEHLILDDAEKDMVTS